MDDRRFDSLTRLIGHGASRRTILKGLLGLGGVAVTGTIAPDGTDARTAGTRVSIPPPPPPTCPTGQGTCGGTTSAHCCPYGRCFDGVCCADLGTEPCAGGCCPTGKCTSDGQTCCTDSDESPCGTICCPHNTCAREGNTDICCAGHVCGLECCASEDQCCDGECCPDGTLCLTKAFDGESVFVEEEVCCPTDQICDGLCCFGTCYNPGIAVNGSNPFTDFECCPAKPGFTFCPGTDPFDEFGACCSGDTPRCCVDPITGAPACCAEVSICQPTAGGTCTARVPCCEETGLICNETTGTCWECDDDRPCEQPTEGPACYAECREGVCTGIVCTEGQDCVEGECVDRCAWDETCLGSGDDECMCLDALGNCVPANEGDPCNEETGVCYQGWCVNQDFICGDDICDGDTECVTCNRTFPAVPFCEYFDGAPCNGETGICSGGYCGDLPTCSDGIKNGDETGVDCGGSCPGCPNGGPCIVGSDCASGLCFEEMCVGCFGNGQGPCSDDIDCCTGQCDGDLCSQP
jgi:hypothetical protein